MKYFNDFIPLYRADDAGPQYEKVQEALTFYIIPLLGHYRVSQFDQPKLEDYRKRIARKGVSLIDFRAIHLPLIQAICSLACERNASIVKPEFASYKTPEIFLCNWYSQWLNSLVGRVSASTLTRYQNTFQKFLLPLLGNVDLRILGQVQLNEYLAKVVDMGGKPSTFSFHFTILYGILDFAIMASLQLPLTPISQRPQAKIGQVAKLWQSSLSGEISDETRSEYSTLLRKYIIPLLGNVPLSHFTYQQWALYRRKVLLAGCSSSTLAKHRAVLNHIINFAERERLISARPELTLSGSEQQQAIHLPDADTMAQILRLESELPDVLIIRLAWQMGLAREEIRNLTHRDLDLTTNVAMVAGRQVPIPPDLVELLQTLPLSDGPLLTSRRGQTLTSQNISMIARKILSRHGLDNIRLADLRHDYIIRLLQETSPEKVAKQCGYKDAEIVLRLYREYSLS